uniref:Uncharacterized protein n=1 Tax=Knipowitschia caucasica TaxID=637954 RepID=A0AAV2MG18_KNICA
MTHSPKANGGGVSGPDIDLKPGASGGPPVCAPSAESTSVQSSSGSSVISPLLPSMATPTPSPPVTATQAGGSWLPWVLQSLLLPVPSLLTLSPHPSLSPLIFYPLPSSLTLFLSLTANDGMILQLNRRIRLAHNRFRPAFILEPSQPQPVHPPTGAFFHPSQFHTSHKLPSEGARITAIPSRELNRRVVVGPASPRVVPSALHLRGASSPRGGRRRTPRGEGCWHGGREMPAVSGGEAMVSASCQDSSAAELGLGGGGLCRTGTANKVRDRQRWGEAPKFVVE